MSKEQKLIERNVELSAEFSRYVFEHTEIESQIPMDAEIVLLPDFDPELKEYNLQLGKDIEASGGKVAYVTIKSIRPKMLSRIEKLELQAV
ncbi:MAG: hypothetical protein HY754_03980 [Nitrospirae bacterium]|nr:hypothetical protein [Nitrospirota bacterium]